MDPIHVVITIIAVLAAVVVMRWARHDFVAWPYFYAAPLAPVIVAFAGFVPLYVTAISLAALGVLAFAIDRLSRMGGLKMTAALGLIFVIAPSVGFGLVPTSISLPEPPMADIFSPIEPLSAAAIVAVHAVDGGTDEAPLVGMDAVVREDTIEGTDTKELFSMICGYIPETGDNIGVAWWGEALDCLENGDSEHAETWIETTEAMRAANPGTNEFGYHKVTIKEDMREYADLEDRGLFDPGVVVVHNMPDVGDDEARIHLVESGDFPTLDKERAMRLPVVHREGPITNTASMAFGEMPFFEDNAKQIRLALAIPTIDPIGGAPMSTSVSTGFVPDLDAVQDGYGTYAECLNPTLPPRKPPAPPTVPPTTPPTEEPPTEEPPTEEPPTEEPPTTEPPTEEPPTEEPTPTPTPEEPTPTPTPEEPTPTPTPTPSPEPESFPACTGLTDDGEEMIEHFPTQEEADEARVDCELKDKDPSKSPINGGDEDGEFTPAPSPDPDEGELEEHQEPTPAPTPGAEDDQNDSVIADEEADPAPTDREGDVDPPATNVPDEPTDPGDNIDTPEGESNPFPGSTITDPVGPVLETESNTEGSDGGSANSDDFEPANEVDLEDGEMSLGEQLGALLAPFLLGGGALQSRRKVAIKG